MTLLDDQPWRAEAACRDYPTDLFFATTGHASIAAARDARAVCRRCPVREECLAYAMSDPDIYGIWGGLTRLQRVKLKRSQRSAAA